MRSSRHLLGGTRSVLSGAPRGLSGTRRVLGGTARVLAAAIIACAALAACHRQPAPASSRGPLPEGIVNPYLAVHEALAKDSVDGIGGNAAAIEAAAHAVGATPVESAALKLRSATTLADAREKFGALSETMVAYTKAGGRSLPAGVRQAWCPMAQKPWLQRGSMISNPYYGTEMPTCGEFK